MPSWQYTPYIIPLLLTTAISCALTLLAWRRRSVTGAVPFALLMLSVSAWLTSYALELSSTRQSAQYFWVRLEYVGIVSIPVAWLAFVLHYTGREEWLSRRNLILLSIVPSITLALTWTNDLHGLIWRRVGANATAPFAVLDLTYGWWFWVHTAYSYALLLLGTVFLLRFLFRSPRLYRTQVNALLIGMLAPWLGNVLYLVGIDPFPYLDLTPFTFTLSGMATAWGLFRFGLLDIVPVAHSIILENIKDGVIVLDDQDRVVDINPAARHMIGDETAESIGQPVGDISAQWNRLVEQHRQGTLAQDEIGITVQGTQRYLDFKISPLYDQSRRLRGQLIVLHDITERKRAEDALKTQMRRQATLYKFLVTLGEHLDTEAICRIAVQTATKLTNWPFAALLLPDQETSKLTIAAVAGDLLSPAAFSVSDVSDAAKQALQTAQTQHITRETAGDPTHRLHELAVPLRRSDRVLGVLNVQSSLAADFFQDDILLAESLAEAIVLALDNAQFYNEAQQNAADLSTLYTITRMAGSSLSLEDTLEKALQPIISAFGFDAGLFSMAQPKKDQLDIVVHSQIPPPMMRHLQESGLANSPCAYAYQHRQQLVLDGSSTQNENAKFADLNARLAQWGVHTYISTPLLHRDECLGTMCLFARQSRRLSLREKTLLDTISRQIAAAVSNARLFQSAIAEQQRLQTLIESSQDGIILVGMDGQILVINAAAIRMLRLPGQATDWTEQPLSKAMLHLRHDAPQAVRVTIQEMKRFQQGDKSPGEGEYDIKPRTLHWLNLPVVGDKAPLGRLLVLHDVTQERQLDKMRDDLTHTLVHDLRNPLTGISVSLRLLDQKAGNALSPAQHRVLEMGQSATQKMLTLVNAILDVSRLESGRMPLDLTAIDLYELVSETLEQQTVLAAEKNAHLQNAVPQSLPPARADATLIERVLANLIGNAVKFVPNGGLIRVEAELVETPTPALHISVLNDGPPIPGELMGRLFQHFATGRVQESGSGLGLAFCKLAIEAHGGQIWAENDPQQGVRFTFTLPPST